MSSVPKSKLIFELCCLLAVAVALCNAGTIILKAKDEDRIVNGYNITIDEFPYIVQILDKYPQGTNDGFLCGGTIISDRHVVSAAHCYHGYNAGDLVVVANATLVVGDEGAVSRDVVAMYRHKDYDFETTDYDVVVLKLAEPLPVGTPGIKVSELCKKSWKAKEQIRISGWGHIKENGTTHSNHLQTVVLSTLGPKKCSGIYKSLTARMSCSVVNKNKDACQGDSGGPAFYKGKLCGIVSFGFGCGRNRVPAIFTNVPLVTDFIQSSMLE